MHIETFSASFSSNETVIVEEVPALRAKFRSCGNCQAQAIDQPPASADSYFVGFREKAMEA